MNTSKEKLILDLYKIGAIKFGEFRLKSGLVSPFYIDLRIVVSYPRIMKQITGLFITALHGLSFDLLTGIPYTALPVASLLSARLNKPLIYPRKEMKSYGTAKRIEGVFESGQSCLVIDDVMTTGESKIEIADTLKEQGLRIETFAILIDRSYKGTEFLERHGYRLISILTVADILNVLEAKKRISHDQIQSVNTFLTAAAASKKPTFLQRMNQTGNALTRTLMERMIEKKTNLILSLDLDSQSRFFNVLEQVADQILMVKTHVDILSDYTPGFPSRLQALAARHGFMIFEDRKFADIGSTVRRQFRGGIYRIAEWSDFVTVHMIPGPGILQGLFDSKNRRNSAFLLAAMSAKGNLIGESYTRQVIEIATQYPGHVSGFIGFGKTQDDLRKLKNKIPDDMLLLTPGVHLESTGDALGQQYVTVEEAIRGGSDAIIVGRGIYDADDPVQMAVTYRERAWAEFSRINL